MNYTEELAFAVDTVRRAAVPALASFQRPDLPVFDKPDGSIVTQADLDVNDFIVEAIAACFPDDAILSEEGPDDPNRLSNSRCWIVDPIDGTSHFERGDRDWSIMLALAVDGVAVVGAVNRPAMGDLRFGAEGVPPTLEQDGQTTEMHAKTLDGAPLSILHSHSALAMANAADGKDATFTVSYHGLMSMVTMLSSGMHAYVTPRTTGYEWDLAPHAAILGAAGGLVTDFQSRPHIFNTPDPLIRGGVIGAVSPEAHARALALIRAARLQPFQGS